MNLKQLNALPAHEAFNILESCCVAPRWVEGMLAARPYASEEQVFEQAQQIWSELTEVDYLSAFEGHPQIGDVSTLREKYLSTADKAGHEQSGMSKANDIVLTEMMEINQAYLAKFGFIFIVCATGKTAEQMLALIKARIDNSRLDELSIAASEQAKITKIRLENLL